MFKCFGTGMSVRLATASCSLLVLVGCSGGAGGLDGGGVEIPVVTPLDGQWSTDLGEAVNFGGYSQDELYFLDSLDVQASFDDPQFTCEGATADFGTLALAGRIDSGILMLYPPDGTVADACATGTFTDLSTLQLSFEDGQPDHVFRNTRVDVDLAFGLWVSNQAFVASEDLYDPLVLKFESPQSVNNNTTGEFSTEGCIVGSDGNGGSVRFSGAMNGLDTINQVNPVIPALVSSQIGNPILFTQVTYEGAINLSLRDSNGELHHLTRMNDTVGTTCPDS